VTVDVVGCDDDDGIARAAGKPNRLPTVAAKPSAVSVPACDLGNTAAGRVSGAAASPDSDLRRAGPNRDSLSEDLSVGDLPSAGAPDGDLTCDVVDPEVLGDPLPCVFVPVSAVATTVPHSNAAPAPTTAVLDHSRCRLISTALLQTWSKHNADSNYFQGVSQQKATR
jgi:hypothetical protein